MSSTEFDPAERAALLLRKAAEDALAVREFAANSDVGDGIIGFHAQQERTQDLDRLLEIVAVDVQTLPLDVDELIALTGFAVPLRYEDILDAESLDREATVALVEEVGQWAASQLSG